MEWHYSDVANSTKKKTHCSQLLDKWFSILDYKDYKVILYRLLYYIDY